MERTQIYIESAQRKELARIAKRKGTTVSQLVREGISTVIERENHDAPKELERIEDHPMWPFLEKIWADVDPDAPISDGSTTYKQALYGGERPWPESS